MIKSITIYNFCSIADAQTINFGISKKDVLNDSASSFGKSYINLVNCFVGHNASGKTSILKAIAFVFWLITSSYDQSPDQPIPCDSHALLNGHLTKISIEFFVKDRLFQYRIELNQKEVRYEFLGEHKQRGFSRIFEYQTNELGSADLKAEFTINLSDEDRFKSRKNVTLFSSFIQTGYLPDFVDLKNFYTNVQRRGTVLPGIPHPLELSRTLQADASLQQKVLEFIAHIDLGISNFDFSGLQNSQQFFLECVHESQQGRFNLGLVYESHGTLHGLSLLIKLIPILEKGGVVVIDEIETGLHPFTVKKIISLFENKETNPYKSQLIFSTHQHSLMNDRTKTQIFIAEKKDSLTEVFCLNDVTKVRNDDNYFHKYLQGAYGGIGKIDWI